MESNSSSNNELNPFASPELSEHLSNTSVAHNEEALEEMAMLGLDLDLSIIDWEDDEDDEDDEDLLLDD